MPPRASLTGSFSVSDANNEVVCPLKTQDGSTCRKRCFGEKRYRSMQEHIRRAHPEHYISKLPATEESFNLMINTTPSERPPAEPSAIQGPSSSWPLCTFGQVIRLTRLATGFEPNTFFSPEQPPSLSPVNHSNNVRRPSVLPAAAALAQLSSSRPDPDWSTELAEQDNYGLETESYLHNYFASPGAQDAFNGLPSIDMETSPLPRDEAPNFLSRTPSQRASSLQPFGRFYKGHRSRKSSVTENARRSKHERERSRDLKRLSLSHDRKAASAEPSALGNKWEDLLDAAASATEADSRDLTPVSECLSEISLLRQHVQIPQSPRSPQPSFNGMVNHAFQSYATSPLQNSVLPQTPEPDNSNFAAPTLEPFPSVEEVVYASQNPTVDVGQQSSYHHHHSSNESGHSNPFAAYPRTIHHQPHSSSSSFHIPPSSLSSSSPHNPAIINNNHHIYPPQYSPIISHYSPTLHQHPHPTPPAPPPPVTPPTVQHYCAACHRISPLTSSYACTECICGICRDCVDVLVGMGPERGARCPRCKTVGGRFKPFMLDLR